MGISEVKGSVYRGIGSAPAVGSDPRSEPVSATWPLVALWKYTSAGVVIEGAVMKAAS
jgi:hypothetical protein